MTHTKNAAFNKLRSPELFSLLAGCDEEFVAPPPLEQNPTLQLAYAVFFDVPGIERLKAETP